MGNPPVFLGNVTKLHASVHPSKKDKWEFSNKDDLDPCLSCFVKCSANELYADVVAGTGSGSAGARRRGGGYSAAGIAPVDQLYLFIELITTVRCPQNLQMTRKGVLRGPGSPSRRGKDGDKDATASSAAADRTLTKRFGGMFGSSRDSSSAAKSQTSSSASGRRRDRDRDRENEGPERDNDENDEPPSTPNRPSRSGRGAADDEVDEDAYANATYSDNGASVPTVEMSAGWVMIPIAAALFPTTSQGQAALALAGELSLSKPAPTSASAAGSGGAQTVTSIPVAAAVASAAAGGVGIGGGAPGSTITSSTSSNRPRKLAFEMRGGTPFAQVGIDKEAVVKRDGMQNAMRRAVGIRQRSIIEVLIKPVSRPPDAANKPKPVGAAGVMATAVLPPNIVLPSNSVSCVGIFRGISDQASLNVNSDRLLPQSGSLPYADVILIAFPRILADPAASKVLFALWAKEAPALPIDSLSLADVQQAPVVHAFRSVVLRVYRAFSSPDAQPDRLNPYETAEDCYHRMAIIRSLIGMPSEPSNATTQGIATSSLLPFKTSSTSNASAAAAASAAVAASAEQVPLIEHLYTPFNARELVVPTRNIL